MIGDLTSVVTTLATRGSRAPLAPAGALIVGERGISTPEDLERLSRVGIRTFLVGDSLLRVPDVAAATRTLLGAVPAPSRPAEPVR